jgi:hypothetical protein
MDLKERGIDDVKYIPQDRDFVKTAMNLHGKKKTQGICVAERLLASQ